jgi:hypothetical protein
MLLSNSSIISSWICNIVASLAKPFATIVLYNSSESSCRWSTDMIDARHKIPESAPERDVLSETAAVPPQPKTTVNYPEVGI